MPLTRGRSTNWMVTSIRSYLIDGVLMVSWDCSGGWRMRGALLQWPVEVAGSGDVLGIWRGGACASRWMCGVLPSDNDCTPVRESRGMSRKETAAPAGWGTNLLTCKQRCHCDTSFALCGAECGVRRQKNACTVWGWPHNSQCRCCRQQGERYDNCVTVGDFPTSVADEAMNQFVDHPRNAAVWCQGFRSDNFFDFLLFAFRVWCVLSPVRCTQGDAEDLKR